MSFIFTYYKILYHTVKKKSHNAHFDLLPHQSLVNHTFRINYTDVSQKYEIKNFLLLIVIL